MKRKLAAFMAMVMIACSLTSLSACKKETAKEPEKKESVSKSTTSAVSKISDVPTEKEKIVQLFDNAISYVDEFCYSYTKSKKNTVKDLNVGSLSSVSNSADAFKSIFAQGESRTEYNYSYSKENFNANFPKAGVKYEDVENATATEKDGKIIVTLNLPSESNPTHEKGRLQTYTRDFLSVEDIKSSLETFASSAGSISVNVDSLKMVAVIRKMDSSLERLTISFTETFNLSDVKLVEIKGSNVSGKMVSESVYTEIG
ncbi:MAG: hypothetical protein KBT46_02945 [Ruminococcus sp.]|nr:hypothetical protein [Candidatus Copronaster equi]